MPRHINFDTMKPQVDTQYGRNELGSGSVEIVGRDSFVFSFWNDGWFKKSTEHCGKFFAEMQDTDSPKENQNALADEIFRWAEENLKGKWLLLERSFYRGQIGYQDYVIEDSADRTLFQEKWGAVFKYEEPSKENPEQVLSQYEKARQEEIITQLKAAWNATRQVFPLYDYPAQSWFFIAARINDQDRLFIVPEDERAEIENAFNVTIEPNKIKHMNNILNGQNDLEAGSDFTKMVSQMIHGYGDNMFRAREVDYLYFNCLIGGNDEDDQEALRSYDGKDTKLEDVRQAYQGGQNIRFVLRGISFTYNIGNPLVAYHENTRHSTAIIRSYDRGICSAVYAKNVSGYYRTATGLAEGLWSYNSFPTGCATDGYDAIKPQNCSAVYSNGKLISGSLSEGDDRRFQPAAPVTRLVGYPYRDLK